MYELRWKGKVILVIIWNFRDFHWSWNPGHKPKKKKDKNIFTNCTFSGDSSDAIKCPPTFSNPAVSGTDE